MSISKVAIYRSKSTNQGTFGVLLAKQFKAYTLELPWRDNKRGMSCIPKGTYIVRWTHSFKFKRKMYLVFEVKDRSGIRIHSANYAGDSEKGYKKHLYGCIALGKRVGILEGQLAILIARPTMRKFEKLMENKSFQLEIK